MMLEMIPHSICDAGDEGCGDLVMLVMKAMQPLAAGQILAVRATDPAAVIDIPAGAALTGHETSERPSKHSEFHTIIFVKRTINHGQIADQPYQCKK